MAMATGSNCGCCNMNRLSAQQESKADDNQHNGKNPFQQATVKTVRQLGADTGKKDTGGNNTNERRQVNETKTHIRQVRVLPAGPDIANRTSEEIGRASCRERV